MRIKNQLYTNLNNLDILKSIVRYDILKKILNIYFYRIKTRIYKKNCLSNI